jgi:hypothetical protein
LRAQRLNEFEHIRMTLTVEDSFINVGDERSRWLQHPEEVESDRLKPCDVVVGIDAAVGVFAAVGVGRRCEDEIDGVVRQSSQFMSGVAFDDTNRRCRFHTACSISHSGVWECSGTQKGS